MPNSALGPGSVTAAVRANTGASLSRSSYFQLRSNAIAVDSTAPLGVRCPTGLCIFRYDSICHQVVDVPILVQVIHVHANEHSFVKLNQNTTRVDLTVASGEQYGISVNHFVEVNAEI
jgi:hypothetical protein